MNTTLLGAACALSLALTAPALAQDDPAPVPQPDEPYAGPASTADDEPAATTASDDDVDETLRVQVLLDRANFSPGEIDGAMGSNTRRAIAGFQRYHGLPDTGELDAATRKALDDVS